MAFLILTPIRRWLFAMLLVPVAVFLLDRFTDAWCDRKGDGFVVGRLRWFARWLSKYEAGPLAHDDGPSSGR